MTTHSDPSFDQRIADWLELDPNAAPDAVLDTVLAAVPSIPQRRRGLGLSGWRTNPMTSTLKLALGAAAAIALVVAGLYVLKPGTAPGVGGPSPTVSPSPRPSPTPAWQSRSSDRFAYSIHVPGDWLVTEATEDWPDGGWPSPTSRAVDRFGPPADEGRWVMVSSRELASDETAADVRAALDEQNRTICDITNPQTVSVDGHEARTEEQLCFGANHVLETLASDGVRVFLIDWISPAEITEDERAIYAEMLGRFTFTE
jgi:hypothetical protein